MSISPFFSRVKSNSQDGQYTYPWPSTISQGPSSIMMSGVKFMKNTSLNTKRQAIHLRDRLEKYVWIGKKKHGPHPQGAISRSNTNRPVLYTAWLDIRTLEWFIEHLSSSFLGRLPATIDTLRKPSSVIAFHNNFVVRCYIR